MMLSEYLVETVIGVIHTSKCIGSNCNCHELSVAATEIDIKPAMYGIAHRSKYGIRLIRLSLTGSGVSRGVLRVLQHPPMQLNNRSQHKKLTTLVALTQQIMGRASLVKFWASVNCQQQSEIYLSFPACRVCAL
jgi:hypothetical protein